MTKKNAFTLAEVLITLGIIGVIAALTIPNVMFSTDKRQAVVGLKKAMTTLDQAVDMARTDPKFQPNPKCYILANNADADDSSQTSQCSDLFTFMKNVLQVQKYCKENPVSGGCMAEYADTPTCTDWNSMETKRAFMTTDGMSYFEYNKANGAAIIGVDVNGMRGPNKWGYDIFSLQLTGTKSTMQTYVPGGCEVAEDGGSTGTDLLEESDEI